MIITYSSSGLNIIYPSTSLNIIYPSIATRVNITYPSTSLNIIYPSTSLGIAYSCTSLNIAHPGTYPNTPHLIHGVPLLPWLQTSIILRRPMTVILFKKNLILNCGFAIGPGYRLKLLPYTRVKKSISNP